MDRRNPDQLWDQYRNRIIGTSCAIIFALITMSKGFWTAVGFFLIIAIGYLIGAFRDRQFTVEDIRYLFNRLFR